MSAPIDWSRPIELDTVPPRPARWTGGRGISSPENYSVLADWEGDGDWYEQFVCPDGVKFTGAARSPRVRNVTTPTDDVTAELLAALKECAKYLQDEAGGSDEVLTLLANTNAAIARAEARK